MTSETRQPHAVLDLPSRGWKAKKIANLLDLAARPKPFRLLEVGTGSGGIAHWFATQADLRCEVVAVDVCDSRLLSDAYEFREVDGVELPFVEGNFDVVISNHVIEHVGDADAQARHLSEIRRVMKPGGTGYLAVPNRWMLTEPHYRLKFLSWWPRSWRTPYLKLMGKGSFYDCEPLQMRQLERMLGAAGFIYQNLCVEALRETFEIERPQAAATRLLRMLPDVLFKPFLRMIPTLIYRIERTDA